MEIKIEEIKPSPYQPRKEFDIEDLKGSIQTNGILMPLVVRRVENFYELIDGERRLRTAKVVGLKTVPVSVMDIPDNLARQLVWKLNVNRKDYTTEEKAYFFKKMQDEGMSLRGIATEFETNHHDVSAYINVFRLPDDYQKMVWDRIIPVGVIRELESIFAGTYVPQNAQVYKPSDAPELFALLDKAAREKNFGFMQVRESLKPILAKLQQEAIEKAKEVVKDIKPTVNKPETPEELEKASRLLRKKAKDDREAKLTPEEKVKIYQEKKERHTEKERERRERKERELQKAKLEGMKEVTKDTIKKNPMLIQEAIETIIEEQKNEPTSTKMTQEELGKIEEYQKHLQEIEKGVDKNKVARNKNWLAHGQIISMMESLKCPCCGKGIEELVWKCCDVSVKEAHKKLKGGI